MTGEALVGAGFAFAAVVQPGPLQAFLLTRAASFGWRRTLPAALSPLVSDGPIAVVAVLVLGRLPDAGQLALRAAGGLLLLVLAWTALRQAREASGNRTAAGGSVPATLSQAVIVNLLNPNPYLAWTLVMGPAVVAAWAKGPSHAAALVGAFYGVMTAGLAAFIVAAGAARLLPERGRAGLVVASAVVLALLGVHQWLTVARAVL